MHPDWGDIGKFLGSPVVENPGLNRDRWGNRVLLDRTVPAVPGHRPGATFVDTAEFRHPIPIAVQFRFLPTTPFIDFRMEDGPWSVTPFRQIKVTVRRGIDPLGGIVTDVYHVTDNAPPPIGIVLARRLTVEVELEPAEITALWVEVVATPLTSASAEALVFAPFGTQAGWRTSVVTRVDSTVVDDIIMFGSPLLRQFLVQNNASSDLALGFGSAVSFVPGAESWSVLLPGGQNAIYESPVGGFAGDVHGAWRSADPNGEALVTTGLP